jgi:hypothetical protein
VPGVAVEAYVVEERMDEPDPPRESSFPVTRLGKLPPGFGARRLEQPGGSGSV